MRALLFDFDGLILDTETPEVVMWTKIFERHSVSFPTAYWVNALGRGASEIQEKPLDLLQRLVGRPLDLASLKAEYDEGRMELIHAEEPLPGVVELIRSAKVSGVRTAVVSSSRHAWVDGHLSRLGLVEQFDTTVCADDVERAKPHPDLYRLALERLGVSAEAAIALEDSPNGVAAARAAGIFVVAVPNQTTRLLDLTHASSKLETLEGVTLQGLDRLAALSPK